MKSPNLKEEKKLWRKGYKHIACIDEAGRGPLAGPVVAAAVMIDLKFKNSDLRFLKGIRDSKKLSSKKREESYKIITNQPAIKWGIGVVSERVIDKINIKNAAELAMAKALANLKIKSPKLKVDYLIIDGNQVANLKLKTYNLKLIVKADEKIFSCAAASIIAKVTRDRIMARYHKKYPRYGFDKHKGYPTKYHVRMLKKYGQCDIHRKSYHYGRSTKTKTYQIKKK